MFIIIIIFITNKMYSIIQFLKIQMLLHLNNEHMKNEDVIYVKNNKA